MKYAIISDVHSNSTAFNAVIEDVKKENFNKIILLGDYCGNLPFPNEIVDVVRGLDNNISIRGNWEDYLTGKKDKNHDLRKLKQFASLFWNADKLTQDNFDYLQELPKEINIIDQDSNKNIKLIHNIIDCFPNSTFNDILSQDFLKYHLVNDLSFNSYLNKIKTIISHDIDLKRKISLQDTDIYLFGHSHLQFHFDLGGKLFINPGSCGVPLDGNSSAAYTILELNNDGYKVTEKRVKYDIDKLKKRIRDDVSYQNIQNWYEVMITSIVKGTDELTFFLAYVGDCAKKLGDDSKHYSNEVWNQACKGWNGVDLNAVSSWRR